MASLVPDPGRTGDVIVAAATASGPAAIAVVRLSGPPGEALAVARRLVPSLPASPRPRHAYLRSFVDGDGAALDEGLVLVFPSPRSVTGEEVVELSAHGSPAVVDALVASAVSAGARRAEPGEFTRRGLLNGRLDLASAEGIAALVAAGSRREARGALGLARGELTRRVRSLADELLSVLAAVEATLDFPEDVADADGALGKLADLRRDLAALHGTLRAGVRPASRPSVVIAGAPNAGKSTLFNALLGWDRAIVTDRPGTTRDAVDGELELAGERVRLFDTAGLRETADEVEGLGVAVTRALVEGADLVLFAREAGDEGPRAEPVGAHVASLRVLTKADLAASLPAGSFDVAVSALHGTGLAALREAVAGRLRLAGRDGGGFLALERHRDAVGRASEALGATESVRGPAVLETVARLVREALAALGEVTGECASRELLDRVFSGFCIGK